MQTLIITSFINLFVILLSLFYMVIILVTQLEPIEIKAITSKDEVDWDRSEPNTKTDSPLDKCKAIVVNLHCSWSILNDKVLEEKDEKPDQNEIPIFMQSLKNVQLIFDSSGWNHVEDLEANKHVEYNCQMSWRCDIKEFLILRFSLESSKHTADNSFSIPISNSFIWMLFDILLCQSKLSKIVKCTILQELFLCLFEV